MKPNKSNDFAIHIFHGHVYYLFATLLLFSVSVKFELAIPLFPLRVSLCGSFDMGVESRDGGMKNRPRQASLEVTSLSRDADHN